MDFPKIKKEISQFLSSEEAKVLKKDIAKLGLTASVIASIIAQAQDTQAQGHTDHGDVAHGDHLSHSDDTYHTDDAHSDASTHTSHNDATGAHSSYPIYDPARNRGGHNSTLAHANW